MAAKALPAREVLLQLLRYEPETGKLFWRERSPEMFDRTTRSPEHRAALWNAVYAGTEAFTNIARPKSSRNGTIFGVKYYAHRVIWKLETGEEAETIDHINGDPGDNRFANLRSVSAQENGLNRKRYAQNTSGIAGVGWHNDSGKWRASIRVEGKRKHLGYFDSIEDARTARLAAELQYGFHPNHGRR